MNLPSFVWGGGFFAVRKGGASERVVGHGSNLESAYIKYLYNMTHVLIPRDKPLLMPNHKLSFFLIEAIYHQA